MRLTTLFRVQWCFGIKKNSSIFINHSIGPFPECSGNPNLAEKNICLLPSIMPRLSSLMRFRCEVQDLLQVQMHNLELESS